MTWSIIITIAGVLFSGCLGVIFGIIGMVNAKKANDCYDRGDKVGGDAANSTARTMVIVGGIVCVLGLLGVIAMTALGVFSAANTPAYDMYTDPSIYDFSLFL
ncbi:MAG: CD225/dispanin family protein [Bacteroidales bacterium]|nr:CD225/dispanin family protein [Bacteroidales bacterium]